MSEPLVVIGNGMAAARFVEELDLHARGRYAIAVIGAEPHLAYNRVLLSSLLAGEVQRNEIELRNADWWRARGVTLLYGSGASRIDVAARIVELEDGRKIPFAKLIIATGSVPMRLPVPGAALDGVMIFRDLDDAAALARMAETAKRAVVIGGGLLGLEASYGLAKQGAKVTLLHLMPHLMERQLDPRGAELLRRAVEAHGIEVICNADTAEILGSTGIVEAVRLKDGRIVEADLVVMALGVRPNTVLAKNAGLAVNRGIVVDDRLATSIEDIFAIGECAEHRGVCYGLVEPAYEQANTLARELAGKSARYDGSTLSTNLKVSGVAVFSAGDFSSPGNDEILFSDPGTASYKRLIFREEKLAGAILVGDTADGLWYLELIREQKSVARIRDSLAFGRSVAMQKAA